MTSCMGSMFIPPQTPHYYSNRVCCINTFSTTIIVRCLLWKKLQNLTPKKWKWRTEKHLFIFFPPLRTHESVENQFSIDGIHQKWPYCLLTVRSTSTKFVHSCVIQTKSKKFKQSLAKSIPKNKKKSLKSFQIWIP